MATATITTLTVAPNHTQVSMANAYANALVTAGYTLFSSYNASSTEFRVMRLVMSPATKGTIFLRIGINFNTQFTNYDFWETWNPSTNTGTVGTGNMNYGIGNSTSPFILTTVSHPEANFIIAESIGITGIVGILRPKGTPPSWWNENNFPYFFGLSYNGNIFTNSNLRSTSSPYGINAIFPYFGLPTMQDPNPHDSNKRAILPYTVQSVAGQNVGVIESCEDVVICASNGLRYLDTLTVSPSEVYTYAYPPLSASGLAIRTT